MNIKDYMETGQHTVATLAREAGLSRKMIYDYMNGTSLPGLPVAIRIEKLTGGKVTLYDWIQENTQPVKKTTQLDDLL